MKKEITFIFIISLLISACAADIHHTDSWETVVYSGRGTITIHYVPSDGFAYYDADGRLTGVTAEIFRDFVTWIENKYGYDIAVHNNRIENWGEFYNTVMVSESGTFGMGNVTITAERMQEIDFSPPYMTNIAVLITHSDTPELNQLGTMKDGFGHLRALAFEGTLHEERINRFRSEYYPALEIDYAHSNNEIIETVASGDRYFAYVDVYNYWRARESGMPLRRHSAGDEPSEQFGYIMPDNSDWTPVITRFFERDDGYLNSNRYREIMETYLGTGLAALLEEARLKHDASQTEPTFEMEPTLKVGSIFINIRQSTEW
jgi:hypothetical protein